MRSADERVLAVRKRSAQRIQRRSRRMRRVTIVAGGMASMAVIVLVSVCVAGLGEASTSVAVQDLMGSVFARGSALGYVVVGLLGVVLGVTTTLLSVRWEGPSQRVNTGESFSSWQTDDKDAS